MTPSGSLTCLACTGGRAPRARSALVRVLRLLSNLARCSRITQPHGKVQHYVRFLRTAVPAPCGVVRAAPARRCMRLTDSSDAGLRLRVAPGPQARVWAATASPRLALQRALQPACCPTAVLAARTRARSGPRSCDMRPEG